MSTVTDIDLTAPVIARHEIEIHAPLDRVWGLHVDVSAWPTWNPDITDVITDHALAPGVTFRWQTAGLTITSTVHALAERERILWSGAVAGITGVHEWTFQAIPDGVRVATEESWSGEPVSANVAAMQTGLDQSLVSWLRHLKIAAEAGT